MNISIQPLEGKRKSQSDNETAEIGMQDFVSIGKAAEMVVARLRRMRGETVIPFPKDHSQKPSKPKRGS